MTPLRADLIAVDIGNSSTHLGVFDGDVLAAEWRVSSALSRTADEIRHLLRSFFDEAGVEIAERSILCSVVPSLTPSFVEALTAVCGRSPRIVDGELDLGVTNRYRDPGAVGPDRLANAVAAAALHGLPAVIVDLGTATTFDVVSARGEYLGGAIAAGMRTAADVLFQRAARLPRVELTAPARVIGRNTAESIQAGIVLGAVELIDGLVERIAGELGVRPRVIATGGDAGLIEGRTRSIEVVDRALTLKGLRIIAGRLETPPGEQG